MEPDQPCLHPASEGRLESGMVFNIEPAVYLDAVGGLRHCDMVALNGPRAELLTSFQGEIEELFHA